MAESPEYTRTAGRAALDQRVDSQPPEVGGPRGRHQAENALFSTLELADGPMLGYDLQQLPRTPAMVEAEASRRISTTPIPKLDAGAVHTHAVTPLERIPRVDEHHCVGCNLCSLVCPVEGCITIERVDNGLAPQSWSERTTAAPVRS